MSDEGVAGGVVGGVIQDLDLLDDLVRELRELSRTSQWASDLAQRYSFNIRWGTMLAGRLKRISFYATQGQLSAVESARYEQLRRRLHELDPLLQRFRLARPKLGQDP